MSELSRLRWRCRRGIKEMDLILQAFMDQNYSSLSLREKVLFEEILNETDLDIMDWILDRTQPDNREYDVLIQLFRQDKLK